jgi:hypothetical protein
MPNSPIASERVGRLDLHVQWSRGAPEPHLMQSESRAFLAFYLRESDVVEESAGSPARDGASKFVEPIGVVEWMRCVAVSLGPPNENGLDRDRRWHSGLGDVGPHAAGEVSNSRWIADLNRLDRADPDDRTADFDRRRHFILGFHDSTFECVAYGFRVWTTAAPMDEVLRILSGHLLDRADPPFQLAI